jgi:hypothetical protein
MFFRHFWLCAGGRREGQTAPIAKPFHDTVRHMNKRALLYAGFLTAAVAVLLTSGRLHRALSDGTARAFASNK